MLLGKQEAVHSGCRKKNLIMNTTIVASILVQRNNLFSRLRSGNKTLNSAIQQAMPPEFGNSREQKCLNGNGRLNQVPKLKIKLKIAKKNDKIRIEKKDYYLIPSSCI